MKWQKFKGIREKIIWKKSQFNFKTKSYGTFIVSLYRGTMSLIKNKWIGQASQNRIESLLGCHLCVVANHDFKYFYWQCWVVCILVYTFIYTSHFIYKMFLFSGGRNRKKWINPRIFSSLMSLRWFTISFFFKY